MIDQSAIQGEKDTGYEASDGRGLFACSNCEYFADGHCHQKIMMAKSSEPKNKQGFVKVDPAGCCEYVERPKLVNVRAGARLARKR